MSGVALTWAFQQDIGDAIAKLVLVKLADQANDDGVCWPARRTMAAAAGVTLGTVTKKIKLLRELGFVTVEERQRGNGSQTSNVYRLAVPPPSPAGLGGPSPAGSGSPSPGGAARNLQEEPPSTDVEGARSTRGKIYDALVEHVYGVPAGELTSRERRKCGMAAVELEKAGAGPEDVGERVSRYKTHPTYGRVACTAPALVAHWSELAPPGARAKQQAPACSECEVGGGMHAAGCSLAVST